MKISCEIIKDLLPLYIDGVCSNDSKEAIEEHISDCDNCKAELQAMQIALPAGGTERNLQEAEAVKRLSEKWKYGMTKSTIKGVLIATGIFAALLIIAHMFVDFRIV